MNYLVEESLLKTNSHTLPEAKIPEIDGWKMNFPLGNPIFRFYVRFRECIWRSKTWFPSDRCATCYLDPSFWPGDVRSNFSKLLSIYSL